MSDVNTYPMPITEARRIPYVSLLSGVGIVLLYAFTNPLTLALNLANPTLSDALSCHWVHWTDSHLI